MSKRFTVVFLLGVVFMSSLALAPPASASVAKCADGIDNDRDGLIDFPADPQCSSRDDDSEAPTGPGPAKCADGIDNDRDGLIDFPADPDCTSRQDDTEVPGSHGDQIGTALRLLRLG